MGMAKPRPSVPSSLLLAVTTPTTWPLVLYTGPPELPSFTAASNWNMVMVPSSVVMSLSVAETMPLVME